MASPTPGDERVARPVDYANAPGKKHELEPIPGGDIANLPPGSNAPGAGGEGEDVEMVDTPAPEDGDEVGESGEEAEDSDSDEADDPAQLEAARARLEASARRYLAAQTMEVIIPSYAAWFDLAQIHAVERRALPEFFNGRNRSKTPSIYKEYRDFMINTYRLRPTEYLTVTACRRNLAGDVCTIMRVHAFLEQWGLINYQVDPETRPAALQPPFTGHFRVILDTPRGLSSSVTLHGGSKTAAKIGGAGEVQQPGAAMPASLELRQSIYQTSAKASKPLTETEAAGLAAVADGTSAKAYACDTCGADCTRVRYHSLKSKMEICPACYADGRFPSSMFSGDFVKLSHAAPFDDTGADAWTDAETLLLLEAIEMYDDDWARVAEHVGTRTAQQCIRHFVQLPIEDSFVGREGTGLGGSMTFGQRLPFERADNPVMSVVAFLAGAVSPAVAADAAQTALGTSITTGNGESTETNGSAKGVPPATAAKLALGASAKSAARLASVEEQQIGTGIKRLVSLTLRKLELKMDAFEELENVLEEERANLERARAGLVAERVALRKARGALGLPVAGVAQATANAAVPASGPVLGQSRPVDAADTAGPVEGGSVYALS
ncbi:SWIRM-domain-containing protein [Auriculariales sp. MPI-PUGE-AT-0066]|nr:SWIRM-domain-containing protein [Auriculariales sp. MPI-PUGE-AT-0066]